MAVGSQAAGCITAVAGARLSKLDRWPMLAAWLRQPIIMLLWAGASSAADVIHEQQVGNIIVRGKSFVQ
eukprot:2580190-Pleurochrysis_carterae.AAC.5